MTQDLSQELVFGYGVKRPDIKSLVTRRDDEEKRRSETTIRYGMYDDYLENLVVAWWHQREVQNIVNPQATVRRIVGTTRWNVMLIRLVKNSRVNNVWKEQNNMNNDYALSSLNG